MDSFLNPLPTVGQEGEERDEEEEEEEENIELQKELGAVGGQDESIEQQQQGKYGTVYSAMANELAIKFYPINQIPRGGVIGENVWQSGNQFYVEKSLTGIKVAIKHVPPPQLQPWDDPNEESDELVLGAVGGFIGLLSADLAERIGHPLEEVRKLMKLNHPNLVEIYNVLEDEEKGVYIVMEYFEMNLKQWVDGMHENEVRLDDPSIDIFLQQMIDGLAYLHKNNIVHNDLHSGNVMVTEDQEGCVQMKIVDFGQSEYFSDFNSPALDIKGLGQLLKLVMTLLDSEHQAFKEALNDFIYTCVKGVFSNMDEVQKEFDDLQQLLATED